MGLGFVLLPDMGRVSCKAELIAQTMCSEIINDSEFDFNLRRGDNFDEIEGEIKLDYEMK